MERHFNSRSRHLCWTVYCPARVSSQHGAPPWGSCWHWSLNSQLSRDSGVFLFWWRWCYLTLFPQRRSKRKKNLVYVVRRLMVTIEPITGSIESDCLLVDVRCREKPTSVDFPLYDCDKDCLISISPNFVFWKKVICRFPTAQSGHT